jgi:hypothetical protein
MADEEEGRTPDKPEVTNTPATSRVRDSQAQSAVPAPDAQTAAASPGFFNNVYDYVASAAGALNIRDAAPIANAPNERQADLSPKANAAQTAIVDTLNEYLPDGNRSAVREKFIDHMVKNSPAILYSKRETLDGGRHHKALNKLLSDASAGTWREHDTKRTMSVATMKELAGNFVALNDGLNERAVKDSAQRQGQSNLENLSPAAMRVVAKNSQEILSQTGAARLAGNVKEALHLDARHKLNRLNRKEGNEVGNLSKDQVRDLAAEVKTQRTDKVADLVDKSGKGAPTAERLADNIVTLDNKITDTLAQRLAAGNHTLLQGNIRLISDYIGANSERIAKNPVAAARCVKELNEKLRANIGLPEDDKFKALPIGTIRQTAKLMQQRDGATLDYLSMAKDISSSAEIKSLSQARFGKEVAAQHANVVKTIEDGGLGEKSQAARRVVLEYVHKNSDMETVKSRDKAGLANELGKVGDMPYRNPVERAIHRTGIPAAASTVMSPIRANMGEAAIGIQDRDLQASAFAFSQMREGMAERFNTQLNKGIETTKADIAEQKVRGLEDRLEKYFPPRAALGNDGKSMTEIIKNKALESKDFETFKKELNKVRRQSIIGAKPDEYSNRALPKRVVEDLFVAHHTHEALAAPVRERQAQERATANSQSGGRLAAAMDAASSAASAAGTAARGVATSVASTAATNFIPPAKEALAGMAASYAEGLQEKALDALVRVPELGIAGAASHFADSVTGRGKTEPGRETPATAVTDNAASASSARQAPASAAADKSDAEPSAASASNSSSTIGYVTKGAAIAATLYAAYTAKQALDRHNSQSAPAVSEGGAEPGRVTASGVIASAHESVGQAITSASGSVNAVLEYGKSAVAALPGTQNIRDYMTSAQETLGQMTGAARDAVSAVPGAAGELAQSAANRAAGVASTAREALSTAASSVAATAAGSVDGVSRAASTARDAVSTTAKTAMADPNATKYGYAAMAVGLAGAAAYTAANRPQSLNDASAASGSAGALQTAARPAMGVLAAGTALAGAAYAGKLAYDSYSSKATTSVSFKTRAIQAMGRYSGTISSVTGIPPYVLHAAGAAASAQQYSSEAINAVSARMSSAVEFGKSAVGLGARAPGGQGMHQLPSTPAEYRSAALASISSAASDAVSTARRAGWDIATRGVTAATGGIQAVRGAVWGGGASQSTQTATTKTSRTAEVNSHANDRDRSRANAR